MMRLKTVLHKLFFLYTFHSVRGVINRSGIVLMERRGKGLANSKIEDVCTNFTKRATAQHDCLRTRAATTKLNEYVGTINAAAHQGQGCEWAELPHDIIFHIFAQLPILLLARLACVSKRCAAIYKAQLFKRQAALIASLDASNAGM